MVERRVLVVEDSPDLRLLFARVLRRGGLAHEVVADAASAIDALEAGGYGVVLLDKGLGVSSGFDVLAHLRAHPHLRATRVIMVSGDSPQAGPGGLEPDRYLMKPVGVDELLSAVEAELALAEPA